MEDIIIIGAGAAGLTAAVYAAREGLNTLILEKAQSGGLASGTELIENYPGFPEGTSGMGLMDKFKQQAQRFGAKLLEFEEVKALKQEGKRITIEANKNKYSAYTVIVASGSIPKQLNVPGEETFRGKGVSYCATCDGPLFKNKDVAVIGCGNSGLQEAETLLHYVKSVTLVEFLPYMSAAKILQDRLQKNKQTAFFLNHALISINGKGLVDSITVKDRNTGAEKKILVSGVFIYAGFLPNSQFLKGLVKLDELGYIITDEQMQTSLPGLYAAGDIRAKRVRQIDTACADGTIAAISARDYIKEIS